MILLIWSLRMEDKHANLIWTKAPACLLHQEFIHLLNASLAPSWGCKDCFSIHKVIVLMAKGGKFLQRICFSFFSLRIDKNIATVGCWFWKLSSSFANNHKQKYPSKMTFSAKPTPHKGLPPDLTSGYFVWLLKNKTWGKQKSLIPRFLQKDELNRISLSRQF